MAENLVEGAILDWQDPIYGSFELGEGIDLDESDGGSATVKYGLNGKAIGAARTVGETTLMLTQAATVENGQKPDWYILRDRRIECLLTTTEVGGDGQLGARKAYTVIVSKVDRKVEKGEAVRKIELKVLSVKDNS